MIEVLFEGPEDWGSTAYPGDAGIDLPITQTVMLAPGEFADLPSGIKVAIPEGYYGRIAARSGALRNKRIRVYEGVIDAGYRGELYSYVENVGPTATIIQPGDRLAQLIIQPVVDTKLHHHYQGALPPSARGARGFGSSDAPSPNGHGRSANATDRPATQREIANDILAKAGLPPLHPQQNINGTWPEGLRVTDALITDVKVRSPRVYLGGPIDFHDHAARANQVVTLQDAILPKIPYVEWFDPLPVNQGEPDPLVIWKRNHDAMDWCDLAVFLFPNPDTSGYGFGSPTEIIYLRAQGKPVILWHNSENVGVYLRKLWADGMIIAQDWHDFIRVFGEELAKVGSG